MAQEIFEVEEQFFEAGAGDVEQAELGLGRGRGSAASLGDILAAGAGGLHHLVHGAGMGIEEFFAEPVGGVVNQRCRLEADAVAIAAAGSQLTHAGLLRLPTMRESLRAA